MSLEGLNPRLFNNNLFLNEYNLSLLNDYPNLCDLVHTIKNFHLRSSTQQEYTIYKSDCPICVFDITPHDDPTILVKHIDKPCNYIFHSDCLKDWLKINSTCPVCKIKIKII